MDFWVGVELCRRYGLTELKEGLRSWKPVKEPELLKPVKEPELSEFIEITDFASPVMVRMSDFRINASHIVNLAGSSKRTLERLRNRLDSKAYEILRGNRKRQGTYVDFDIGIGLCRDHGLPELEKRLLSLRRTSKGPV